MPEQSKDRGESPKDRQPSVTQTAPPKVPAQPSGELQVRWDDANMTTSYANVVNVASTREEVTLFFGTNQTWKVDQARELMPADVSKDELARFFHLRAAVRANLGDEAGAVQDFETAFSIWPVTDNPAIAPLEALYARAGNKAALDDLRARLKRTRASRS